MTAVSGHLRDGGASRVVGPQELGRTADYFFSSVHISVCGAGLESREQQGERRVGASERGGEQAIEGTVPQGTRRPAGSIGV